MIPPVKILKIKDETELILELGSTEISFVNGCFELPHMGYATFFCEVLAQANMMSLTFKITELRNAKYTFGHTLLIAVNDDESFRKVRGTKPLYKWDERVDTLISCLQGLTSRNTLFSDIDKIIFFKMEETNPCKLLRVVQPGYIYKGSEYKYKQIPEKKVIKSYGGEINWIKNPVTIHGSDIKKRILEG